MHLSDEQYTISFLKGCGIVKITYHLMKTISGHYKANKH